MKDTDVLPCDVTVGSIVFRKGVKVSVLQAAASRWYEMAKAADKKEYAAQTARVLADV